MTEQKYSPANLKEEAEKCSNLTKTEKDQLLQLLNKYKSLFDGSLGTWKTIEKGQLASTTGTEIKVDTNDNQPRTKMVDQDHDDSAHLWKLTCDLYSDES